MQWPSSTANLNRLLHLESLQAKDTTDTLSQPQQRNRLPRQEHTLDEYVNTMLLSHYRLLEQSIRKKVYPRNIISFMVCPVMLLTALQAGLGAKASHLLAGRCF